MLNKQKISLISFLFIFPMILILSSCATPRGEIQEKHTDLSTESFLSSKDHFVEIDHGYFKVIYDPQIRLAKYTIYRLRAEDLKKPTFKRKDNFKADPILKSKNIPLVEPKEYVRSGFDRGHLVPSADLAWNEKGNDLTFVMSNMVPQKPKLNRDSWRRLEDKVRRWACGEGEVTVLTGPLFSKSPARLKSGLSIPEKFFKVIVDETPPRKILAFIYEQDDEGDVLKKRLANLASIQESSQINLGQVLNVKEHELRKPATETQWKEANCQK